jgi:hypothetical protein
MATLLKLALALLLVGSVLLAYLGPPPRHASDLWLRGTMLATAIAAYAAAGVALASGAIAVGVVAIAGAGELICAAGWLSRGEPPPADDDDDSGGGGGGHGPRKPPPVDWDAFERAFGRYARERDRSSSPA